MVIKNETVNLILSRRSVRFYTDQMLTKDEIDTVLECAKRAPSAKNLQPCCVREVHDRAFLNEINEAYKSFIGEEKAKYTNWEKSPVYQNGASVFFIFTEESAPDDVGIMAENMVIAAKSLGLDSVIIRSMGRLLNSPKGDVFKDRMKLGSRRLFGLAVSVGHADEKPEFKERDDSQFFSLDLS